MELGQPVLLSGDVKAQHSGGGDAGRPALGDHTRCRITITEDKEFKVCGSTSLLLMFYIQKCLYFLEFCRQNVDKCKYIAHGRHFKLEATIRRGNEARGFGRRFSARFILCLYF